MDGRGFQPRPRPLPKALGRGDSKRDVGTWTAIELLGLILAGRSCENFVGKAKFFLLIRFGFGKGRWSVVKAHVRAG